MHRTRVLLSLLAVCLVGTTAQASYTININQVGTDLVATGSGSIDLTDLSHTLNASGPGVIAPGAGIVRVGGPSNQSISTYHTITGPASFGALVFTNPDSGSGPVVGVSGGDNLLVVPAGYVSGASLGTTTATYLNQSFSSTGLDPGTYTWTWGSGPDADSFTVQVGPVTPEPASLGLLAIGGMAMGRRRRA
jgi:hypothetical protein